MESSWLNLLRRSLKMRKEDSPSFEQKAVQSDLKDQREALTKQV